MKLVSFMLLVFVTNITILTLLERTGVITVRVSPGVEQFVVTHLP
jgi:hypothetical protein